MLCYLGRFWAILFARRSCMCKFFTKLFSPNKADINTYQKSRYPVKMVRIDCKSSIVSSKGSWGGIKG
uniref:Putative secreted protein n=1 Tax=Anopheles marajoara TaxID=58244 RepID=A0A2M4CF93_9DIPT